MAQGFIDVAEMRCSRRSRTDVRDTVEFLYHFAWRSGEAMPLQWSWIDGDMIRLPAEVAKKKARALPIVGALEAVIQRGSRQLKGRRAALVLVAVEKRAKASGRLRMAVIPDFKATTLSGFIQQHIAADSTIYTDALKSFTGLDRVGVQVNRSSDSRRISPGRQLLLSLHSRRQHLLFGQWDTVYKSLHRCFAVTPSTLMGSFFVVELEPLIQIGLQLFDRFVELLAKRHSIELVEHRFVKPLADPIGLRTLRLGARVIDVLQGQVQLVLVMLRITAILRAPIGQHSEQ
jgi:transposase-like protein